MKTAIVNSVGGIFFVSGFLFIGFGMTGENHIEVAIMTLIGIVFGYIGNRILTS